MNQTKLVQMNRPSESDEAPRNPEFEISVPLKVAAPVKQSAFPVTEQQWSQLREQVERIRPTESIWYQLCSIGATVAVSFGIGTWQLWSISEWARIVFLLVTVVGLTLAIAFGIFAWQTSKQRKDDIEAALDHMDQIKNSYQN